VAVTALLLMLAACSDADADKPTLSKKNKKSATSSVDSGSGSGDAEKEAVDAAAAKFGECGDKKKIWLPDGDECGAALVSWCCTLDEIKTRFPGTPESLDEKFNPGLGAGYHIYGCSQEDKDTVKVHLVKREDGKTAHDEVSIKGLVANAGSGSGTGSAAECKVDIKALLGAKSSGSSSGSTSGSGSAGGFAAANEILKANCDGKGCHGTTAKAYPAYVDNEDNVKAQGEIIAKRIQDEENPMPIGGLLSKEDQKVILDFLGK
jgi:hypothetical protein